MNKDQIHSLGSNPDIVLVGGSIKGAMKAANASSRDLWIVQRSAIRVIENFNVRIHNQALKDHIRGLANSMKLEGFKPEHPLAGYVSNEDGALVIYLTDGHNRLDAFDLAVSEGAEMSELPMVISSKGRSMEDITVGLVTSNTGKPLDPLEKAFVCKRLTQFNWDSKRIAERLGFSAITYVDDLLMLAGSPIDVIQMVSEEKVSAATAIQMLKQHGNKAPQMLQEGLERAKTQGKAKLTKRFTTDPGMKFVTRSAPTLFTTVKEISADPAFQQLEPNLREKVETLMKEIADLQAKANMPQKPKADKPQKQNTFVSRVKKSISVAA